MRVRNVNELHQPHQACGLSPDEIRESLDGVVEPEDIAASVGARRRERQSALLARADRLLAARERLGLGLGVPPRTLEALSEVTGRLMRRVGPRRPRSPEVWRRRTCLPGGRGPRPTTDGADATA